MNLPNGTTQEDLKLFLQEAEELLQLLGESFVRLEEESSNMELLNEVFRAVHTLKGSSAMVGHRRMSELAHSMEGVLDGLRRGSLAASPQLVDALLNCLDLLKALKEEMVSPEDSGVEMSAAVAELEEAMEEAGGPAQAGTKEPEEAPGRDEASGERPEAAAKGRETYRIRIAIDKESRWAAVRCFQVLNGLSSLGEVIRSVPSAKEIEEEKVGFEMELFLASTQDEESIKGAVVPVPEIESIEVSTCRPEEIGSAATKRTHSDVSPGQKAPGTGQTVRVDVSRLDSLMEQIGELAINSSRVGQIAKALEAGEGGDELVYDLSSTSTLVLKIVNTLQYDIMRIRMLPIDVAFGGLPRMVRELARRAGKRVDLRIEGEETEVDRSVIEHIRDPLIHLLRNAVDHGVETPQGREAAGKPETGVIRLSAYHRENRIVISVEDDGKGLDARAIKDSVVKRGLMSAEAATRLTDAEAIELIFDPGVSTAEKATEISGRGVGLDIVRANIESLNGSVSVAFRPGEGTRLTLVLPLTLATFSALLVSAGDAIYAIPSASVVRTAELRPGEIKTVGGKEIVTLGASALPLLRLARLLGRESEAAKRSGRAFVVAVKADETQVVLAVDSLIGLQETVSKSLGGYLDATKGVSGATILGDGRVALILDVASLVRRMASENQVATKDSRRLSQQSPTLWRTEGGSGQG